MNTKIYITSFIALSFALPAMAAPSHTGTFPSGGLMLEDYTYTDAAIADNMDGVYEGTVNANAQYTDVLYQIAAGQYLPADSETVINCNQPGYFCPGVSGDVYYDENNAQGLTSCSTATNGDYTLSDGTGSTADTCYRTCSGNVTIEHATGVTGNDYYGNGTDTCEPTSCENGWHVNAGIDASTIASTIETKAGYYAYRDNNGNYDDPQGKRNAVEMGIPSGSNKWSVAYIETYKWNAYNKGILFGSSSCSSRPGAEGTFEYDDYDEKSRYNVINSNFVNDLTDDETGQEEAKYCYCNIDGYITVDGNTKNLSSPWVFWDDNYDTKEDCESSCVYSCGYGMADNGNYYQYYTDFRAALIGSIESSPASCEANTITINWGDTDSADVTANEAGTCTYGGNINTPVKAQRKNGKRFVGWTFSKPSGN